MIHFSIIIPLYNCEETITKVISCVKNQNYPKKDFEIICVDDKSGDRTIKIVDKTKVKLIKLSRNGGNGKAKNLAIRKAKGKILFFVDDHLYLNKNALLNLDFLFKKYPNISGVCGRYRSLKKSDMNVCRDIRRRTIYGKDLKEKEISSNSFLPFSVCLGAIKKEIFQNLKFPEGFRNSAEDILLQINCHRQGKIFLYSPTIKGIHDHNLNCRAIIKKFFIELRGVGDLLSYSSNRNVILPFQYCFLSYPLFLMVSLILLLLSRVFLLFFFTFVIIEIFLTAQCFKDKEENMLFRFETFVYCFLGEIIKGFYLPYYLISKPHFRPLFLAKSFYQFLEWEGKKFRKGFNLLFLNKQKRLEYAKT